MSRYLVFCSTSESTYYWIGGYKPTHHGTEWAWIDSEDQMELISNIDTKGNWDEDYLRGNIMNGHLWDTDKGDTQMVLCEGIGKKLVLCFGGGGGGGGCYLSLFNELIFRNL